MLCYQYLPTNEALTRFPLDSHCLGMIWRLAQPSQAGLTSQALASRRIEAENTQPT